MPRIYQDCLRCGREFYIKESEQEFWKYLARKENRELRYPKHCFGCRKIRREEAAAEEAAEDSEYIDVWEEEDGYERRSGSRYREEEQHGD